MTAKKKLRQHPKPPTRSALARPIGSALCRFCGHAEDKTRGEDGMLYTHKGYSVHNGCIKIYVILRCLEELDEPNTTEQARAGSASPGSAGSPIHSGCGK